MPLTNPIAGLFGHSPFKSIQVHMRVAVDCARQVTPLLQALCANDEEQVQVIKERIFELEAEADKVKNDLRAHLPKSLFMPVDRRDRLSAHAQYPTPDPEYG